MRSTLLAFALALFLVACGGSDGVWITDAMDDTATDVATDVAFDAASEATPDTVPDATVDALPDTLMDTSVDTPAPDEGAPDITLPDIIEDIQSPDIPGEAVEIQTARSEKSRDTSPSTTAIPSLTAGNRAFGFDLYHRMVAENPGTNIFLSPHSISIALVMAYAGALGDTADEMQGVLHFGPDDAVTHEAFNALDLILAARGSEIVDEDTGDPFRLSIVNAAWGQVGYPFLPAYLDVLAENYGAGMFLLDFLTNAEASRLTINDWVAWQSMDRIRDLLPQGSIDASTRLVLTNVIYFKANWLQKFLPEDTVDGPFTRTDQSTVTAKMMTKEDDLPYADGDGYQLLAMPYVGNNVSMVLVLPDPGRFAEIEAAMTGPGFDAMWAAAMKGHGRITLPRFTFRFESALNDALQALGMTTAFDAGMADFSGMDGLPHNLFISLVFHKSFVAIDELGTEAAAATAVVMSETSVPTNVFDVTFNRPFLFAIVDQPTGALLFVGRVMDPTAP